MKQKLGQAYIQIKIVLKQKVSGIRTLSIQFSDSENEKRMVFSDHPLIINQWVEVSGT